jgi:hypothetical protein
VLMTWRAISVRPYVGFGVQQQIFGLEVSVHHHVAVAVLHAAHNLLEEVPRLVLAQPVGPGEYCRFRVTLATS